MACAALEKASDAKEPGSGALHSYRQTLAHAGAADWLQPGAVHVACGVAEAQVVDVDAGA